jgi:phospholipid N-methyltransferase
MAETIEPLMGQSFFEFFKASLKNPLQLSTMFETSPGVGRRFARQLNLSPDQYLVEFGVGAGAITVHLLPTLGFPPKYVGFELNKDLHKFLIQTYPNLEFYNESAEHVSERMKGRKVGAIVSTLPWTLMTKEARTSIVEQAFNNLERGGLFCTFVSLHVLWSPAARDFINQVYETFPAVSYEDKMWAAPPCRLFFAYKH